ncbi:hypothetical protein LTSESEN_5389 [Salmonella enterica subsp. enterica serovar Senftenberg str. A4-543]|uniref:Uncharacterized protein n=1 Tax=Salmonella enterica subsp. enterica serovar Senftenberg str. A4-543 TaxID=913082 RepID=G5R6R3_SALSE|nr:hypothetical protein LTSESEN_5389 [Salmonella enterica subsp. enterica serovar Senftenberg str. A4-543]
MAGIFASKPPLMAGILAFLPANPYNYPLIFILKTKLTHDE